MSAVDTVDRAVPAADLKGAIDRGLPGQWWALCAADWLKDKPLALTRLGLKLVLWRDAHGRPQAIEDRCPHRGAPLSLGQVHEGMISCWYHGVTLDGHGTIRAVPALPGCSLEGKKGVTAFPVVEKANCLFAYFPTAASPEPVPLDLPEEFDSAEWSHFLCTSRWHGNYQLALDNLVDPMHGSYLHAKSYTLAYGAKTDRMKVERTATGFVVSREGQHGVNFDWTEYCFTGADWVRLDLPYPKGAGPGGMFRILGFVTPIDERACQVFFWRLRKVAGWQRDLWRFMYRNRLEERHWNVLEQDRIVIEGIAPDVPEMLYQHDIGVSYLRRLLATRAKRLAEAEAAKAAAAKAAAAKAGRG